jgi:SAM-dependent methyltransferase
MNCYYCDKFHATDDSYNVAPATRDLGSDAPRCDRHWRFVCAKCGEASHFAGTAFCTETQQFFCSGCATASEDIDESTWGYVGYNRYQSPWSGNWEPALDRLEFEGNHPLDDDALKAAAESAVSDEVMLTRYPSSGGAWRESRAFSNDEVQQNWNTNAVRWDANYDDDGDRNRRYQSDEPMLELLGDMAGLSVLDVGSGNGYLSRKLARVGASMTGVELSDEFFRIATERESIDQLGIKFHNHSATDLSFLEDATFDKAVSNYVLMDIADFEAALSEVARVLKPGGLFIVVISHPAFASGPGGWNIPAADSPRVEDRESWRSDSYFHRGAYLGAWGNLDPVLSFHRPIRDYWRAFRAAGFVVDDFEEPSITERGRRELSATRIQHTLRVPFSCIFKLVKSG